MRNKSHIAQETHAQIASQNIRAELGRMIAGSFYDHQEVRITEFNRIKLKSPDEISASASSDDLPFCLTEQILFPE